MAESEVIDRTALDNLLEMVNHDTGFLAEMIDEYFADTPKQLTAIRRALATGNAAELRRAAHAVKSNSANFGAMKLSQMCKELEDLGKNGVLDGGAERLAQVEAEYAKVQRALQAARPTGA